MLDHLKHYRRKQRADTGNSVKRGVLIDSHYYLLLLVDNFIVVVLIAYVKIL